MLHLYRYEDSILDVQNAPGSKVFLAGPTVRGNQNHLTSWRFDAIKEFEKLNFSGSLIIPEFASKTESDKGQEHWLVPWENNGLSCADCILLWLPRTKELIGLTTNFEFGYWLAMAPQKIVYGRPADAYRNKYVDLMWGIHHTRMKYPVLPIYDTLEKTVRASTEKLR